MLFIYIVSKITKEDNCLISFNDSCDSNEEYLFINCYNVKLSLVFIPNEYDQFDFLKFTMINFMINKKNRKKIN